MAELVKLHNTNDIQTEVKSADGEGIFIMPNTKTDVEPKFNWNLPPGVVVFRPSHTVFGKKSTKEVASAKALEEQSVDLDVNRKTINSGPTPPANAAVKKVV